MVFSNSFGTTRSTPGYHEILIILFTQSYIYIYVLFSCAWYSFLFFFFSFFFFLTNTTIELNKVSFDIAGSDEEEEEEDEEDEEDEKKEGKGTIQEKTGPGGTRRSSRIDHEGMAAAKAKMEELERKQLAVVKKRQEKAMRDARNRAAANAGSSSSNAEKEIEQIETFKTAEAYPRNATKTDPAIFVDVDHACVRCFLFFFFFFFFFTLIIFFSSYSFTIIYDELILFYLVCTDIY